MTYEFLVMALLFLVPGALIWLVRVDLRGLMRRAALASLPFAATEWLFYPEYWTPRFLFGLADRIGFGLEDVLFVAGLGAFSSCAYAVAFRQTVVPRSRGLHPWRRAAGGIVATLAMAGLLLAVGVPILYASVAAMVACTLGVLGMRQDLLLPSLLGAAVSGVIYLGLCLVFELLVPGVFERTWRPSLLLRGAFLGVPLDELLYGAGAGLAATAFPAWAFELAFAPLPSRGSTSRNPRAPHGPLAGPPGPPPR
ncbi:lycopene cyclase domain-containing protein [Archangium lansingense]|uniref:Lycopene cyclase domain-containing protein n=1 Tax=Archangium lansingense TaxID=2995310 RepID=A0ABT3ZW29_9BACT|nr:lycopene cyclase domain-containing protein [Archangium lansinium]MCY1073607.1 lycopene cyclase domain-containing protein [Archangium lansinium]